MLRFLFKVEDGKRDKSGTGVQTGALPISLMTGVAENEEGEVGILESVKKDIGPHAKPDKIQYTPALPKTRSGKIMRRILRKIAEGDTGNMGDISTLADPGVVDNLVKGKK